jgi:hypothetical protein
MAKINARTQKRLAAPVNIKPLVPKPRTITRRQRTALGLIGVQLGSAS